MSFFKPFEACSFHLRRSPTKLSEESPQARAGPSPVSRSSSLQRPTCGWQVPPLAIAQVAATLPVLSSVTCMPTPRASAAFTPSPSVRGVASSKVAFSAAWSARRHPRECMVAIVSQSGACQRGAAYAREWPRDTTGCINVYSRPTFIHERRPLNKCIVSKCTDYTALGGSRGEDTIPFPLSTPTPTRGRMLTWTTRCVQRGLLRHQR